MSASWALIVAAGTGQRFGGDVPKQYQTLAGKPILRRTIEAFMGHPSITGVQVVIHPAHERHYRAIAGDLALPTPVKGGTTRQASVRAGLDALVGLADRVLIQDAARPFVAAPVIDRVLAALDHADGAISAIPVADTLKRVDDGGRIVSTVPRAGLWRAQTPQGFRFKAILEAHRLMADCSVTDDAAVAEGAGLRVAVVPGDPTNIKITTPEDSPLADRLVASPGADIRTGTGFDVHRLVPGEGVILGGVLIPCPFALSGHSDADVGLHALTDALLGAIAEGDIGHHFPPSDPQWKGADSRAFLAHARALVRDAGATILNTDLTLICERPKIGPHRDGMREAIASVLELDVRRVSVKATTTERLGFTGRGEGIAAQAVATVRFLP